MRLFYRNSRNLYGLRYIALTTLPRPQVERAAANKLFSRSSNKRNQTTRIPRHASFHEPPASQNFLPNDLGNIGSSCARPPQVFRRASGPTKPIAYRKVAKNTA